MALIKLGPLVSDIAGKVGGVTFQRNRYGQIVRNTPKIVTRRTQHTNPNRSNWQANAREWALLSPSNRASWNAFAPTWPWTNKFGDPVELSGFNIFCQFNALASMADLGFIKSPNPVDPSLGPSNLSIDINWSTYGMKVSWTSGPIDAKWVWALMITRPLSVGISNPRSWFRIVTVFGPATTSPQFIGGLYETRYPEYIEIQGQYFLELLPIRKADGMPGTPVRVFTVSL